jgi:hypothetical protein
MISSVQGTMDGVGFVKTFREQIRSVCDVENPWIFKEVETLFLPETCTVLTSSIRALAILLSAFAFERTGS